MANYAAARKIKYPYIMRKKGIRNGAPVIEGTGIQVMAGGQAIVIKY
jgi:uncharacterized protein (DUF433 family)